MSELAWQAWLTDYFRVLQGVTEASSMFADFEPIKSARLYWLPCSSEIVLRAPHWLVDGLGILMFWDALFKMIEITENNYGTEQSAMYVWGEEVARLAPTMEELFGYDTVPTPQMAKEANDLFTNWGPSVGPPSIWSSYSCPGNCGKADLEFEASTAADINTGCKRRGVSVTAAVEAAKALAIVAHADSAL